MKRLSTFIIFLALAVAWVSSAAKAYYPYVKECPGGWHEVSAQPISSQ
jgi:hypothetical protein